MLETQNVYQKLTKGCGKRVPFIIYNKVYVISKIDLYQESKNNPWKTEKKMHKVLLVRIKVVPLHPLSRQRA